MSLWGFKSQCMAIHVGPPCPAATSAPPGASRQTSALPGCKPAKPALPRTLGPNDLVSRAGGAKPWTLFALARLVPTERLVIPIS